MATLRNKRKLVVVSRETPENTRNSQSQNTLDPGMAQEYISQVSEEIEGRVTKKFSKEFSRTESRILGALSKLDEFFLNPRVRTCSVAVAGTSRNNDSGNREPTGDCSPGDPCPEAVLSACHTSHLNDSKQEETHHSNPTPKSPKIMSGNTNDVTLDLYKNVFADKNLILIIYFLFSKVSNHQLDKCT